MKKSDYAGIAFLVLFVLGVIFFPFGVEKLASFTGDCRVGWTGVTADGLKQFGEVTNAYPYIMGFVKFALLAMFGEMLKERLKTGSWRVDLFPVRVIV